MTNLVTQAEFARLKKHSPGYITQLKQKGMLVMRGKLVNISETEKKLQQLSDPSKQGVANRHAQARDDIDKNETKKINHGTLYQKSRALNEHYKSLSAKADYELKIGKLMVADDVINSVSSAAVVLRTRLEALPDLLASVLSAETDEEKIKAYLQDNIEHILAELSRQFSVLSHGDH